MIFCKDSKPIDCIELANNMRQAERDEVWASHRFVPMDAVFCSYSTSAYRLSFFNTRDGNDRIVLMTGIQRGKSFRQGALIWALTTDEADKCNTRDFLKWSRVTIEAYLKKVSFLWNYVDVRHKKSVNWLEFLGADFGNTTNFNNVPFAYFEIKELRRSK